MDLAVSPLHEQLCKVIDSITETPALSKHGFFSALRTTPANLYQHCLKAAEADPLLLLLQIAHAVQTSGGWPREQQMADLVCHASLLAYEHYVEQLLSQFEHRPGARASGPLAQPHVPIDEATAAAVIGAIWLRCGLKILVNDGDGSFVTPNVISELSELQFRNQGHASLLDVVYQEINSRFNEIPGYWRSPADVTPENLMRRLRMLADEWGARLVVGLHAGHWAAQSIDHVSSGLRDIGVGSFVFGKSQGNGALAGAEHWQRAQTELLGHFRSIMARSVRTNLDQPRPVAVLPRAKVFISYSRVDDQHRLDLLQHLTSLERQGKLSVWDDTRIGTGQPWRPHIDRELRECKVAVLLISPAFLASEFIASSELPILLARHEQGGMAMVPVLIRHCTWSQEDWLQCRQMLPGGQEPVAADGSERDRQLAAIANEIVALCKSV